MKFEVKYILSSIFLAVVAILFDSAIMFGLALVSHKECNLNAAGAILGSVIMALASLITLLFGDYPNENKVMLSKPSAIYTLICLMTLYSGVLSDSIKLMFEGMSLAAAITIMIIIIIATFTISTEKIY